MVYYAYVAVSLCISFTKKGSKFVLFYACVVVNLCVFDFQQKKNSKKEGKKKEKPFGKYVVFPRPYSPVGQ